MNFTSQCSSSQLIAVPDSPVGAGGGLRGVLVAVGRVVGGGVVGSGVGLGVAVKHDGWNGPLQSRVGSGVAIGVAVGLVHSWGLGHCVGAGGVQYMGLQSHCSGKKSHSRLLALASSSSPSSAWDVSIGNPYRKASSMQKATRNPAVTKGLG